jgi:hypothetical protein
MWTITTGTRCSERDVVDRCRALHRKVSKINDVAFMKKAGARFVFRSTEFGEVVETGDGLSLHPHCHAVLLLSRFLPKSEWSHLIARIREHFGAHCQDNGRIKEPREFVKYCVKPSDLETLSGKSLVSLYHVTGSLRLVETLRDLRVLRKDIRETDHKLVRHRGILKRVPKWNKGATLDEIPRWLQPVKDDDDPIVTPFVVAWCAPAPVFAPVTEPLFLVHGLGGLDPSSCFTWADVQRMTDSINVHTKALTVRRKERKREERIYEISQSEPKVPI